MDAVFVCEDCLTQIPFSLIETTSPGPHDIVPGLTECLACEDCEKTKLFKIVSISLGEVLESRLKEEIIGCQHCSKKWDEEDQKYILDECNSELSEVLFDVCQTMESCHTKVIESLLEFSDEREKISWEAVSCSDCGNCLESLYDETKIYQVKLQIPIPPTIPHTISQIETLSLPDQIEFYRPDCSKYLVHLCKKNTLIVGTDNIDYEPVHGKFSAAQILWLIIKSGILEAHQGKGLLERAVCFTEKPLTAIKDTLVGFESKIRTSSINWEPYGIMFEKDYLTGMGICPVLPFLANSINPDDLPQEKYRITFYSGRVDFLHEREWRSADNVRFKPEESIILLPDFESIRIFKDLIRQEGITPPKGYLPLNDLFGFI